MASEIAAVQKVLEGSGLKYELRSAGTTVGKDISLQRTSPIASKPNCDFLPVISFALLHLLQEIVLVISLNRRSAPMQNQADEGASTEGPWDAVMKVIGQAHTLLHNSQVDRVQTDIRVGTM